MDKDLEAKLEGLLKRDNEVRETQARAEQDREQRAAAAAVRWKDKVANELKPSLAGLLRTLKSNGWEVDVLDIPGGFAVTLNKGDMHVHHTGARPFVNFTLTKGSTQVAVHRGTPSSSGSGSADASSEVESVTPEFVQQQVVRLLDEWAKK